MNTYSFAVGRRSFGLVLLIWMALASLPCFAHGGGAKKGSSSGGGTATPAKPHCKPGGVYSHPNYLQLMQTVQAFNLASQWFNENPSDSKRRSHLQSSMVALQQARDDFDRAIANGEIFPTDIPAAQSALRDKLDAHAVARSSDHLEQDDSGVGSLEPIQKGFGEASLANLNAGRGIADLAAGEGDLQLMEADASLLSADELQQLQELLAIGDAEGLNRLAKDLDIELVRVGVELDNSTIVPAGQRTLSSADQNFPYAAPKEEQPGLDVKTDKGSEEKSGNIAMALAYNEMTAAGREGSLGAPLGRSLSGGIVAGSSGRKIRLLAKRRSDKAVSLENEGPVGDLWETFSEEATLAGVNEESVYFGGLLFFLIALTLLAVFLARLAWGRQPQPVYGGKMPPPPPFERRPRVVHREFYRERVDLEPDPDELIHVAGVAEATQKRHVKELPGTTDRASWVEGLIEPLSEARMVEGVLEANRIYIKFEKENNKWLLMRTDDYGKLVETVGEICAGTVLRGGAINARETFQKFKLSEKGEWLPTEDPEVFLVQFRGMGDSPLRFAGGR